MQIWVDADACPKVIKEILYRAAARVKVNLILVANKPLAIPTLKLIKFIQVNQGFDVADNYITKHVNPGDLVITADIPLAADVVKKQAVALNPRGKIYTEDSIRQQLAMRNLMEDLRNQGLVSGGPSAFSLQDRQAFSNQLDRYISAIN